MKSKRNLASAIVVLGAVFALSGCGGGSDSGSGGVAGGNGNGSTSIPDSATASVDAFVAYVRLQLAASSDTSSPILLGNAVAPTSDTASPVGL